MIKISKYDAQWALQFQELKAIFADALDGTVVAIEHVGSTAVHGLPAKPILDIDLIISDLSYLDRVKSALFPLGYEFAGEMGIKERFVFRPLSNLSPDTGSGIIRPPHHLYCCIEGSVSLQNHLLFRNTLLKSPELLEAYAELKYSLAATTSDIAVYVEAKSNFIAKVLEQAGLDAADVRDIIDQNRNK